MEENNQNHIQYRIDLMTKDEYFRAVRLCAYGHHKVRQNKYGICWCVRCGLLINSTLAFEPLKETDKMIVKWKNK